MRGAVMAKFRVEVEVEVENLLQYTGRELPVSTSLLVGLAKDQLWRDVNDAVRLYGMDGRVSNVLKVQS
jgi:hypothetical protein